MARMGLDASPVERKDATAGGFLAVRIAEMNPRHDLAVLDLAWECGAGPLFQEDLDAELSKKRSKAWVAFSQRIVELPKVHQIRLADVDVVGYLQARVFRHFIAIKQIVVRRRLQRRSIGQQLLLPALDLLHPTTRRLMLADVPENNEAAQCFFRAASFRCEDPRERKPQLRDAGLYRFVTDLGRSGWTPMGLKKVPREL